MHVHAMPRNEGPAIDPRQLVERVKRRTGWSLTRLAREAGISHSTLTRTMNDPDYQGQFNTGTLNKLLRLAKVSPSAIDFAGLAEPEVERVLPDAVPPELRPADRHHAVFEMRSRALELAGLLPGDMALVALGLEPREGDIVCVQLHDDDHGAGETAFRLYSTGPFLTVASADPAVPRRPLRPGFDPVTIMGTVVKVVRQRQA